MVTLKQTKVVQVDAKTLRICAKPSDAGFYTLFDQEHSKIHEVDGYVPCWFGYDASGDYIEMEVDLETGQILNWTPPTQEQLEAWIEETS